MSIANSADSHDDICSEFTFVWKIVNFSHNTVSKGEKIESPVFPCMMEMGSEWQVYVYPRYNYRGALVTCELKIPSSSTAAKFYCRLCVCTTKQELLYGNKTLSFEGVKIPPTKGPGYWSAKPTNYSYTPFKIIGTFKREVFEKLLDDTVVLHVHLWKNSSDQCEKPVHFFTETRLGLERKFFEEKVENFSSLQLGEEKVCASLISPSDRSLELKIIISGMNLIRASVDIQLHYENLKEETFSSCTLWIMDKNGTVRKSVKDEFWLSTSAIIENTKKYSIWRHEILSKELPDDILVIRGEVTLSGNSSSPWEQIVYGLKTNKAVAAAMMGHRFLEVPLSPPSLPTRLELPPSALSSDMRSLLKGDGPPPDFELRVGERSFPVHQLVLGARSSVFRAMFASDMQESADKRLDLTDMDEGTAERMLLYAYTDEGPSSDLGWESLVDLYAAADKYAFVGLKNVCGQRILREMDLTSAPIVLQIADRHRDHPLKQEVVEFFVSQGLVAIETENWKKLEQEEVKLANEVLHKILYKNHQVVANNIQK